MNNKTISKPTSKKSASKSNKMKFKETLNKLSQLTKNRNRNKRENIRNTRNTRNTRNNRRKLRINPTFKKNNSTISKQNHNKKNPTINKNSNISRKVNKTISQRGNGNIINNKFNNQNKKHLQVGGAISEKIIKNIKQTIVPYKDLEITFDKIVGYEDVKTDLQNVVTKIEISKYEDIKIETDSYILLYGPPGTGKTYLVSAMAKISDKSTYFLVDSSDISGELVGESQSYVKALFNLAREKVKETGGFSLIFIDEVETILGKNLTGTSAEMHNIFLTELSAGSTKNNGIIFICATNFPAQLSESILSRLGKKIYIGPPSYKDYGKFIDKQTCSNVEECTEFQNKGKVINFCITNNFMPRDIYQLCKIAKDQILENFIKSPSYRITPDNKYAACDFSDPRSIHSIINKNVELKKEFLTLKFPDITAEDYSSIDLGNFNIIFNIDDIPPSQDTKSNYQLEKINDKHFSVAMEKKNKASSQIDLNSAQHKEMVMFIYKNASDEEKMNIRKQKAGKYFYTKEYKEYKGDAQKIDAQKIDNRIRKIEEIYRLIEIKLENHSDEKKADMDYDISNSTIENYAVTIGATRVEAAAGADDGEAQQESAAVAAER